MRRLLALALVLLCALTAQGTVLSGTFRNPDQSGFTGRLIIQLQRNGVRNTCVSPSIVVPTAVVTIQIVNGATQSSPDITPSDCMTPFSTYLVQFVDGTGFTGFRGQAYVTQAGGAVAAPSGGSIWIIPSGLNPAADGNQDVFLRLAIRRRLPAGDPVTGTVANGATPTVAVSWPTSFTSTAYAAMCGVYYSRT